MKALKHALVIAGLSLVSLPSLAQEISYTTLNWPPFIGENEDRNGVLAEVVKQAMEASGIDYSLEFTSWSQALKDVELGNKDAVIGAYYSEERAEKYYYSLPVYSVYTGLVKLDNIDINFIQSFDELNSYRISKLENSVVGETFDQHPFPHMAMYATDKQAVEALFEGQVDFYAGNLDVAAAVAKDINKDSKKLSLVQPPVNEQEVFVMFSKSTENGLELRDKFNRALISLQTNGDYEKIVNSFQ